MNNLLHGRSFKTRNNPVVLFGGTSMPKIRCPLKLVDDLTSIHFLLRVMFTVEKRDEERLQKRGI